MQLRSSASPTSPLKRSKYHLEEKLHGDAIFVMQSSLKLIQDHFHWRYRLTFEENAVQHAEQICKEQEQSQISPFAYIIILS